MELIPILSTIILVATISTFILAVGAYFLYKIQEGKTERYEKKETKTETAEIVEPGDFGRRELIIEKPKEKKVYIKRHYQPVETLETETSEPGYVKHTSKGHVSSEEKDQGAISWR